MIRTLLIAATAALLLGAAPRPATVDYRLGVEQPKQGLPVATVEMRLQGDADGETRLKLPDSFGSGSQAWRQVFGLSVNGASVAEDGPAIRILRHKPNAKLVVRYRVASAYPADPTGPDGNPYRGAILRPDWAALLGDFVFVQPEGREHAQATFRWGKLPRGWRAASDLEHGSMGRWMSVADVVESMTLASPRLTVVDGPAGSGRLRVATFGGSHFDATAIAGETARILRAERAFWKEPDEAYFVALIPLQPAAGNRSIGGTGRGDAFVLYSTTGAINDLRWTLAHELSHTWIAPRIGQLPTADQPAYYWLSEGFTDFFTHRALLRGGLTSAPDTVAALDGVLRAYDANPARTAPRARLVADFWTDEAVRKLPYQRGALLALKWDEDIRRKTGGKADLDDVVLRMRDHYRQFPPGQGPDVVTGLISAAWVVAQLDLRPDIARYADGGAVIPFPEIMFDGCLDARVNVTPGFDAGFDHAASQAAKVVRGVKRRGPAWNSGLRDGMRLDALDLRPGDMNREVVATVRPANGRGRPRTIRYWPYGDADVQTRGLELAFGLAGEKLDACGRKIAGL